jgi:hypothetical protein
VARVLACSWRVYTCKFSSRYAGKLEESKAEPGNVKRPIPDIFGAARLPIAISTRCSNFR